MEGESVVRPDGEEELGSRDDEGVQRGDWVQHITEDGEAYYYNLITEESTWETPIEFQPDMPEDVADQFEGKDD